MLGPTGAGPGGFGASETALTIISPPFVFYFFRI